MTNSPIRLDQSDASILIICDEHPYWHAFRFTLDDARECAVLHESLYHPGDYRQRNAASKREGRRHAVTQREFAMVG